MLDSICVSSLVKRVGSNYSRVFYSSKFIDRVRFFNYESNCAKQGCRNLFTVLDHIDRNVLRDFFTQF